MCPTNNIVENITLKKVVFHGGKGIFIDSLKTEDRGELDKVLNKRIKEEILSRIGTQDEDLFKILKNADIDYVSYKDKPLSALVKKAVEDSTNKKLTQVEAEKIDRQLDKRGSNEKVTEILALDSTLEDNPFLSPEIRRLKTVELAKIAGLNEPVIEKLQKENIDPEDINRFCIDDLVNKNILSSKEGETLGFVGDISRLSGSNLELVKLLKASNNKSVTDYIGWDRADWKKLIDDNDILLPVGEKRTDFYAETLRNAIEKTFPSQYMVTRLALCDFKEEINLFDDVMVVTKKDEKLIEGRLLNYNAINWKGMSADKRKETEEKLESFGKFNNRYGSLGISEIANDGRLSRDKKKEEIKRRTQSLAKFYKNNSDLDLYVADFVKKDVEFDWTGIDNGDRIFIKRQMMTFQRILTLTDDYEKSEKLLSGGFSSSTYIAAVPEEEFLKNSELDIIDGKNIYIKAVENSTAISHLFETIRDASIGIFDKLRPSNRTPLLNDLREIDGYEELFGNQNFCNCEHCRSILSPSAYFVDLMYFVDKYVSKKAFPPADANHPLYLKRRRPDLWTVDLTCENTKTIIPYLQIVNEVLEQYLEKEFDPADIYDTLANAQNSVSLPFNLYLEELRLYLKHFDLSLADIYKLLNESAEKYKREYFELSEQEFAILTTPNPAGVGVRFGNTPLNNFDVQDFIKFAGITREELTALLEIKSSPEIAEVQVSVIEQSGDIQLYTEKLKNLTSDRLDLIHRFIRLWKKLDWTIAETDLLLLTLESITEDESQKILIISTLLKIQKTLALTPEELCVMSVNLPDVSLVKGKKGLYDRLFDREKIFGIAGQDADGNPLYNVQTTLLADKTLDKISTLITAGLGITETELLELLEFLGRDTTADQIIDHTLLSDLYRHARIARGLKLSIADFIGSATLALNATPLFGVEDIQSLLEFAAWRKTSVFSVEELEIICEGTEGKTIKYQYTAERLAAAILEIQSSDQMDKKKLLKEFLQQQFNLTESQLDNEYLIKLTSVDLDNAGIATALSASFTNGIPDNINDFNTLRDLAHELERYTLLWKQLDMTAETVSYVLAEKDVFAVTDWKALTLENLKNLNNYTVIIKQDREMEKDTQQALRSYQTTGEFSADDIKILSSLFDQPQELIHSLSKTLTLSSVGIEALNYINQVQTVCGILGIDGYSLQKLTAITSSELLNASNIMLGALASRYEDEKTRTEKLESLTDQINTQKRDALCDYIISHREKFKFKDRNDLYQFFLLDVEMGGCFRTSRIVCTISSVQIYINRCLANLEQSDPYLNPAIKNIKVNPTWIPADEWSWRKNYRVWEANRKVFLYPENYIDPTLRDNKTHIFKELEDNLLQQKITQETSENAYKKYLAQFSELSRLRYAGSFSKAPPFVWAGLMLNDIEKNAAKKDDDISLMLTENMFGMEAFDSDRGKIGMHQFFLSEKADKNIYYLFARTNVSPYQYYYRTYQHSGAIWGNWIKMDLPIEAEEISTLMHQGKLYIFWNEVKSKEINKIKAGNAQSSGVNFDVVTKYAYLDENGKWTSVQQMPLGHLFSSKSDVFYKSIGYFPSNEDDQDELKDGVFADYQKKVFRKPYASLTGNSKEPIKLSYIWTQNHGVSDVVYSTGSINVDFGVLHISSGGTSFTVTNNQFGEEKQINIRADFHSMEMNTTAQVTILSPTQCLVKTFFGTFNVSVTVTSLPSNIFTTISSLSLSRNKLVDMSPVAINERGSYKNINDSTRIFLKPEYTQIYNISSDSHYIENNYTSFTQLNKTLTQYPWGDAVLNLPSGGFLMNSVSLNTILTDELAEVLYDKGVKDFLSLATQKMSDSYGETFDFKGPYGEYYWEIFYHIPFLIANHLNANQKFKEAKWWYERIFNPTSPESPADTAPSDHNWQFCEFRGQDIEKLKDILNNEDAINAYKRDPFNPHAIARLRQNAYQKTIVMHYIDNLIDWADNLFAHDTRESITEASMLYIMVLDILGKRPVQVGECKTAENMNYEKLADEIDGDSEFLISLEHVYINTKNTYEFSIKPQRATKVLDAILSRTKAIGKKSTLDDIRITAFSHTFDDKMENVKTVLADDDETIVKLRNGNTMTAREAVADNHLAFAPKYGMKTLRNTDSNYRVMSYNNAYYNKFSMVDMVSKNLGLSRSELNDRIRYKPSQRFPDFEIVRQSVTAFCVPNNKNLLQYWDRVEDQLFKIRHCMNVHGVRRSLALFQPPIDPMMLVKAKAAGLSLEDISALLADSAEIPPYRFVSILKSAKQITQMAQSFGKSLLSALEKKDTEELRLLHSTHKRNILRMTKGIKKRQIREAKYKAESLRQTLLKAEDGEDYYKSLIEAGLTNWEIVEQASTHVATGFKTAEGVTHLMAGISFLVPQIGSPFSMKYGGKELGDSATEFAKWSSSMASVASQIAGSARLEAKFQRRTQDWRYKLQLAKKAVVQAEQQLLAADIKVAILEKELEIHDRNIEQSQELEDFYKNKFTNLGLYNYLSSTLNRLYREAYNIAYDLAKMAERTYQFETNSTDFFIANDNWKYTKAGLLAGDKLQVQLATIEKSFLQNNTRRPEITQSFSLSMLNGGELLKLQQTGSCNIVIPEMAFDTLYPGQYRRLIKAVKVTVPCVVGTYTNISAKLTLLGSSVEFEDKAMLSESLLGKNTAITTSSGVNDSGMFEFNFKDERHLPFEGAGAISEWNLSLPSKIRSFNYNTISDVIIQISYTALDGDREFSENALVDMITNHAATHGMYRLLSLKHEFPESFHELINPAEGQPQSADLDITVLHFPYLFNGKDITISEAKIYLKPISGEEISTPANATLNGANISWTASEDIALPGESANIGKIKGGTVSLSGNAIKTWTVNTGIDGLNDSTLEDVLILVKYMVDI